MKRLLLDTHVLFDRMLIAQAQTEGLTIITSDGIISKYGVRIMKSGE